MIFSPLAKCKSKIKGSGFENEYEQEYEKESN